MCAYASACIFAIILISLLFMILVLVCVVCINLKTIITVSIRRLEQIDALIKSNENNKVE